MLKRHILTAVAAVFSMLIVFGCWILTNELLNRQHLGLMNTVHTVSVMEPPEAELGAEPAKVTLSTQEIANILKVWQSSQTQHYHDPYDGQLTMEEAIKAANSGLSHFCESGVLPKELLESDFTQTNAFLFDVQAPIVVPPEGLPASNPAYSFWSVSVSNRGVSILLTLNAYTGQIWWAEIRLITQTLDFNSTNILDLLEEYEAYLGLSDSGSLNSNSDYATKSYENNHIGIIVYKKTGESGHYELLNFSLNQNVS
ncbi:hypothetical protein [Lachnoclostridium phytofermentans]|uniref:hypothetical protein n=1 Tax=Lachnoclostridium phytofermentans TaxID=66219 RepID=UPI0003054E07|nr:hypothetical protein [Lachnoclostridium phytofermentans]